MSDAFVVHTVDWPEDVLFIGVYSTLERAVTGIKEPYVSPYIVRWEDVKQCADDDDRWTISAAFEGVQGYSTKHDACWEIQRVLIDE